MRGTTTTARLLFALALLSVAVRAHAGHDHHHDHHHGHHHGHHHDHAAVKTHASERRTPPPVDHTGHDHDHNAQRALKTGAHAHDDHPHEHVAAETPAPVTGGYERFSLRVWLEALFATALVGAAPVVVLLFVPLGVGNQEAQKPLLRVFLSFAAGGLLGDALLHLLPHSIPHGHDHNHDHGDHVGHADHDHGDHVGHADDNHDHGHTHTLNDLSVWLWTLAGMMAFLMLEKFVRAHTSGHSHSHSHSSNPSGHSHSHGTYKVEDEASVARKRKSAGPRTLLADDGVSSDADDGKKRRGPSPQPIAAAGYLNLAADFAHNFTDGLAIGATFLRGNGWTTTLAMLLHELPHEIGDFAILIQSGFSRRDAMLTQLLTAVGAMVGTVLGLLMEGAGESNSAWIAPFTAGGFIYIACASVMPELLEDCSLVQSLKEAAAMAVGVGLMVLIALNE